MCAEGKGDNMTFRYSLGGVLASLLIMSTAAAEDTGAPYWLDRPVIEAIGHAQIEADPNVISFSVTYDAQGKTPKEAMQAATAKAKLAYADMKKIAGDALKISSSFFVNAVYEQYRNENGYMVNYTTPDKIQYYTGKVELSVELSDIAVIGQVRGAAFAHGPETTGYVSTRFAESTDIVLLANTEAFKDARERAEAIAKATGVKLGRLLVAQQGDDACLGYVAPTTGSYGSNRGYYSPPPPPPPPPSPPPPPPPSPPGPGSITQEDIDALDLPMDTRKAYVTAQACLVYEISQK